MNHKITLRLRVFAKSTLLCMLAMSAGHAGADDTEVFLGKASSSGETRPNVMFVLDTSGSMGRNDGFAVSRLDRMKDAVRQMLNSDLDMNIGLMRYSGAYGGGPVLYPITTLNKEVCAGFDCGPATAAADNVYLVAGESGDVEERLSTGTVEADGNILGLGSSEGSNLQAVGLRYAGINIARGATIIEARLEFFAVYDDEDAADLDIEIEDIGDSEPFTTSAGDVTGRTFHSTSVAWGPNEWYANNLYQSPDVKELLQNVINRDDWCTGNAVAFNIEGNGRRRAFSFDKATIDGVDYIPRLRVVQDPATVVAEENCGGAGTTFQRMITDGDDDVEQGLGDANVYSSSSELDIPYDGSNEYDLQVVGLRFRQISIPRDAVIESAFIRFNAKETNSGDLSLYIYAEDSVKPDQYRDDNMGPIGRNYLSPAVAWDNVPDMLTWDDTADTSDLTSLVQAIVSKPSWDGTDIDNGIAFAIARKSGNGKRRFESHNYHDYHAPELFITYSDASSGSGSGSVATPAYSGTSTVPVYSTAEARDEMLDIVDSLSATGFTPTVDTFYEAALYMRGEGVDYGKQRGVTNNKHRRESYRVSHEDSYTGGTLDRDSGCTDDNLNSSACREEQIIGDATYISPMTGSCQANHIVLLSDGDTNRNSSTSKILSMTGDSGCAETGDEACATELATWLLTTDHNETIDDMQDVTTHTIAFNLEGTGKSFLERVAAAGGGSSYEADSADELLTVFNNIVTAIVDVDTSFTAPAATVNQFNRLTHRDDLYFALFKPAASPAWDGNIKRFRFGKDNDGNGEVLIRDLDGAPAIDPDTGFFSNNAQSWWPEETNAGIATTTPDGGAVARGGAANQLALDGISGIGERRVYTWVAESASTISTPVDLTATAQRVHEDNSLITDAVLNILDTKPTTSEQEAYRASLIQWARGVDVLDSDDDGSFSDIRRSMGDPMHSQPVLVNYAPQTVDGDVRSLIFASTNEGYLHAFDTSNGQEQFAYIPYELLGNLNTFFDDAPGFGRPYGLDGALSVWREDNNGNQIVDGEDSAYLFIGMRRGGSSYYALDITDPDAPKLAWTIQGGADGTVGFETMGQSWSRLTPVTMYIEGQAEDVLVFGGGYDENQDPGSVGTPRSHTTDNTGGGIYIVKATTGELLWSGLGQLGGSEFFTDMEYGFNGHVRTIDINRDGYVDQMYAADAGGQVWRFDIAQYHDSASALDELVAGGVLADFSDGLASAHRRFYNEPDVALIESGGERFLSISIGSGWRAHPLDEIVEDRFYMLRQYAVFEAPDDYGKLTDTSTYTAMTETDLINVTNSVAPSTNEYGWYFDFPRVGEKVLGTSVTFDGKVIFSTYVPTEQAAVCSPEIGSGRAYIMDVVSGAPVLNLDTSVDESGSGDETSGALSLSDRSAELSRGGIPPDAMVLLSEGSVDNPQVLFGGEQLETGIRNRTRRTFWSDQGEAGEIVVTEDVESEE